MLLLDVAAMTLSVKVALVCNRLSPDIASNLSQSARWIKEAARKNVDLVCFGEYTFQGKEEDNYEKDIRVADTIPGIITSKLSKLSKQHSLHIIAGILEREQKALYDSAVLISCTGEITLRYRRINPQWHERNADKDLYREGAQFRTASMPFGKVGVIICGDFFDNSVLKRVKEVKPDFLVVPVAIAIALFESSYGNSASEKWATYKKEWIDQAKNLDTTCILVNSVSNKEKGSHSGGALIVSGNGELLAEAEIGKEMLIYHELPHL